MDITFTLQAGFSGTQADNFNISGTTSSGTLMSLGSVTKAQLTTGHTVNADPTITGGTITSTGVCTTSVNWLTFGNQTPATSILSYFFSAGKYYFNLTEALEDNITITIANLNLHDTFTCDSAVETSMLLDNVTILAGQTIAEGNSNISNFTGIVRYKQGTGITLVTYGAKTDGGTFTVASGTVVTVDLSTACEIYEQSS
jgi:hypothetical protein